MRTHTPNYLHCSLCGFEFEKTQTTCAQGCPLGKFCKLVRCPNCSYEFPEPSQPLTWLQRLLNHQKPPPPERQLIGLDELADGEECVLVCLNGAHVARRNTLAVYGLVPGCHLILEQKRPSFVIRVGETELAFESSIAREIFVRRCKQPAS
jgi:Fe2+ transport system protein FeoA